MNRSQRRQNHAQTRKADPQTLKVHAAQRFQAGALRESEQLCEQILKNLPKDGDTLHLLGALRLKQQRAQEAIALLEKALQHNAHRISCTRNLAQAYANAGHLAQAILTARTLTDLQDTADNKAFLGNFLLQDGQSAEALPLLQAAHQSRPTPDVTAQYAMALIGTQQLAEAEALMQAALATTPGHTAMARNLAQLYRTQGRVDAASAVLERACAAAPQVPELWISLAALHESAARIPEAIAVLEQAIARIPQQGGLYHVLAELKVRHGDIAAALPLHRRAVRCEPLNIEYWNHYASALAQVQHLPRDAELITDLITLFALPTTNHAYALQIAIAMLRRDPAFQALLQAVPDPMAFARQLDQEASTLFLTSPLLTQILQSIFVPYWPFEQVFSSIRRVLLQCAAVNGFRTVEAPFADVFLYALAHQCFLNEYAWWVSPEETAQLATLREVMRQDKAPDRRLVALYGCYESLGQCASARTLAKHPATREDTAFAFLLRRQIAEPLEERRLAAAIPQLTPIENAVSSRVQAMYEENPYPRWDNFTAYRAHDFADYWRQSFLWIPKQDIASVSAPRILIAGCGTGKHAFQTASLFTRADVLAVDLSRASLAFARRKQQELNLQNVTLAQADILKLGLLEQQFDHIESVGVLHHMADPVAGWRVLTGLLKPGGFMKIGLYSELARRHIVAARQMVAAEGYDSTPDSIRQWRHDVMQLPAPASGAVSPRNLTVFRDFFSLSMCRDLAFHVQEHRFTLPQIAAILDELGLEFLGFEFAGHNKAKSLYAERFPEDPLQRSLAHWATFEAEFPDTFRAMYQFILRKKKTG
jgi:tetratricopeptide (TPR) repeat protein